MKANERGNAILISAILVFGLTVTALGVSRLLVKGTQAAATQRQFLGLQAHSLAEAAILEWTKLPARPISPQHFTFPVVLARLKPGPTVYQATATVYWNPDPVTPSIFQLLATASLTGVDGAVVQRTIGATVSCPTTPCAASASLFDYIGGP